MTQRIWVVNMHGMVTATAALAAFTAPATVCRRWPPTGRAQT